MNTQRVAKVAIALALPEEWRGLRGLVRDRHGGRIDGVPVWWGRIGGVPVVVFLAGPGERAAGAAARRVLPVLQPECLVVAGFGGGLADGLCAGRLIVADAVVSAADGKVSPCTPAMLSVAGSARLPRTPLLRGVLVSTGHVLTTLAEKRSVARETGALAADNESAAVAAVALEQAIPFLAVRALTDGAGECMPLDFNKHADQGGRVRYGAVIAGALRRPTAIPGLVRLGWNSARAARHLGRFLEAFCVVLSEGEAGPARQG